MVQLISIILPVYNVEKYIAKSIQSVLNQTYKNFELLIINDGTLDRSIEIAQQFNDDRIKIYNKENGGISDARNYGMKYAKGEYLYFMDSDDWIEADLFEKAVNLLQTGTDVLTFNYFVDHLNVEEQLTFQEKVCLPNLRLMIDKNSIDENVLYLLGYVWNKFYKLSFLKENNVFFEKNIHIYEDVIFNTRIFSYAKNSMHIDECFYHYSDRPKESLIKSYNPKAIEYVFLMNKSLENMLDVFNVDINQKNKLLAQNLTLGVRYFINSIFQFNRDSHLKKFHILKDTLNNLYINKLIYYYEPNSFTDKIYKTIIQYKMVMTLFVFCKFKK